MLRFKLSLLALVFFAAMGIVIADDPSSAFLRAYQVYQDAETSERNGQLRDALDSYSDSSALLEEIKKNDPNWQTMVVDYRLRKAKEGIARLQESIQQIGLTPPERPDPLPQRAFEIDIPAPNVSTIPLGLPDVVKSSPAVISEIPDSKLIKELAEAKAEIKRLQGELVGVKAELSSSQMEVEKTKTEMVAAKSSLAQAEASLNTANQEVESLRAKVDLPPDDKVLSLSSRIADLEAENEFLKEDRERLSGKLMRASDYIRESQTSLASLLKDRDSIAKQRDEALDRIKVLRDNEDEIRGLRIENTELKKMAQNLKAAEEIFQKEKADLEARLAKQADDIERSKELQRMNQELALRLEKAEKALSIATKEKLGKAQLDFVQEELASARARLQALREVIEANDNKTRLFMLQMEKASAEALALSLQKEPTPEQQNLIEESKLLREIIDAQISEQNTRLKEASDMEGRITELQEKSNGLRSELASLAQEVSVDAAFVVVKKTDAAAPAEVTPAAVENKATNPKEAAQDPVSPTPTPTPVASPAPSPANPVALPASRQVPVKPTAQEATSQVSDQESEADRLLSAGNPYEAQKVYQSLVNQFPENIDYLSKLAISQLAISQNTLATKTLTKLLAIDPENTSASLNLANAHTRLGNVVEAARILQGVIRISPENSVAHNYLGVAYGKTRGRHLDARSAFTRSVELDGNYENAHFNLAVSYSKTSPKSLEMAKKHYEIAKKLGAAPDAGLEKLLKEIEPAR